jgi:hypothetical protein
VDFLNDLMGGEENDERKRGGKKRDGKRGGGNKRGRNRREEYRDFADRYDRGAPYENISDEEAVDRYREVAPNLSDDEYRASAREAFSRMSPQERVQFGQQLRGHAREQGHGDFMDRDHDGQDDRFQDPDYLAGMMGGMHSRQPDMLGQLMGGMMGGGTGGMMGGLMGGGSGMMRSGSTGSGMMSNPVAKAAMAGIAAMAVKRMMGGR